MGSACSHLSNDTANTSGLWFLSGFPGGRVLQRIHHPPFYLSGPGTLNKA